MRCRTKYKIIFIKKLYYTLVTYMGLFLQDIDRKDSRIFLESSPLYPNLLSVVKTLHRVGLDAQVGQCDWEYLKNLDSPFLLHIKSVNKQNLVIAKWDYKRNGVSCLNHSLLSKSIIGRLKSTIISQTKLYNRRGI